MRKAFIVLSFIASSAIAQVRITPIRVWYAEEKPDWNHAVAELVEYGGDPKNYVMPIGTPDGHWIMVWETTGLSSSGGYPWKVEAFDTVWEAAIRHSSLMNVSVKKVFTEPTGKVLVVYKCQPGLPCG